MLELKPCCKVPYPEKLLEQYQVMNGRICANVSYTKVYDMMRRFIDGHNEPLFFILELPSRQGVSADAVVKNLPNDVYYMDGLEPPRAVELLDALVHFLVRDGLSTFGFGGHYSHEEILFGKYNVMTLYAEDPVSQKAFFEEFGISETNNLITAWDTFDAEHCGECSRYEVEGQTVFDIPEAFKDWGMYQAERRDSDGEKLENELSLQDLLGKTLLVGISYYTHDEKFIEQKQFWGTVTNVSDTLITMRQKDGSLFTLPPDLSSTYRASPGEYKLRSTGEVVENPDFLATWTITKPAPDSEEES